jgi:hypothetical protein
MEFVRQRATRSYQDNDGLPYAAVQKCVQEFFSSKQWQDDVEDPTLLSEAERIEAAAALLDAHLWIDKDDLGTPSTVSDLKENVLDKLYDKIEDNVRLVHSAYGKRCGLVSKRGTRSFRYAPTDGLLKTLVLANVGRRMEISEFLGRLFARYRIVFAPVEAQAALPEIDYDETAFRKNRARLEERLRSMGLLNRLSDGCAYVENPLAT